MASKNNKETLTDAAGIAVPSNDVYKSVGKHGPLLLENYTLIGKMLHFNLLTISLGKKYSRFR